MNRDERIGSVLNHLSSVLYETNTSEADEVVWDFGAVSFLHPFFLGPLGVFLQSNCKPIRIVNIPRRLVGYLDLICFSAPLSVGRGTGMDALRKYESKTYIPLCCIDLSVRDVGNLSASLTALIVRQSTAGPDLVTPLIYFLGELIDNMFEHSRGERGYLFAQCLRREGCINLLLADDGKNIYESYVRTGKYLDEINGNEALALMMANEGRSTKNRPGAESRGFGISTSVRMLVEGMGGAFFMLSGVAFHRRDCKGSIYANIPEEIRWHGTIILMKIPMTLPPDFNYSRYIE